MRSLLRKALPAVINLCMASNIFINVNAAEIKNQQVENQAEVFYHLFQRSFYDTNGDTHGDLNGIVSKLDYLQDLGVTSLLLLPLYPSIYHHNYFAASFEGIDAEYGDMNDYITMVESIHNRGMKFYMDTEIQYATENHPWFKDSRNNPASPYSEYIIYRDKENKEPETTIFDITHLQSHDGINADITTVSLNSPKVKKYMRELFTFWVDPNKDGDFSDGVDGFRIDHMMDDLDEKGILTNLLTNFWAPLFKQLKAINPRLKIIGEQADWTHYGDEYFEKADVDMTFGFAIREGLISLDKALIEKNTKATFAATPADKNQLLLLENHDLPRFATVVKSHPGKMRIAAAYLMLSEGVPLVYYGQELGMEGLGGIGKESSSFADANDKTQSTNNDWDSAKVPSASDLKKLWTPSKTPPLMMARTFLFAKRLSGTVR
ncbi:MAG: hypothetical protein JKY66_02365 [Spongiibacteraceae bacterium]|nr:hypothetical protein [Spongiibacteraceae bacterium]